MEHRDGVIRTGGPETAPPFFVVPSPRTGLTIMDDTTPDDPRWVAPFLAALRAGKCVEAACREAGVTNSTAYKRRQSDDAFRAAWDAIAVFDGRKRGKTGPRAPRGTARIDRFLEELAHTSSVAAAAAVSGLSTGQVYTLRRTDADFARRWYAALAEGYDNLEMDLLARLRDGRLEDTDAEGNTRKFDFATALRCLTAHRDTVAREKGRRTLAEEAATIESINAKIDALRARAKEGAATERRIRADAAKRARPDGLADG
jgi:hypothetical protein